jgi:hypothetical protein
MLILRAKIFLILYPPFENSTTRIAIIKGDFGNEENYRSGNSHPKET